MILNALGGPVKIEQFVPRQIITPGTEPISYPEKSYFYEGLTVEAIPQSFIDEIYQQGYDSGYEAGQADAKPYARELEYIEGTGTQYIDTKVPINSNLRTVLDIQITNSTAKWIFGYRTSSTSNQYCILLNNATTIRSDYGSKNATITLSSTLARMVIDKNKNVTTIGNIVSTLAESTFSVSNTLTLFALDQAGSINGSMVSAKLYSCQIYDDGTLVRDFIPVLDFSGVPCLYDKINKQLYYNRGTGSFNYS